MPTRKPYPSRTSSELESRNTAREYTSKSISRSLSSNQTLFA